MKRYSPAFGVLLEIVIDNTSNPVMGLYAMAAYPPWGMSDPLAYCVDGGLRKATSPNELLDSLPPMKLADRSIVFAQVREGIWQFAEEVLAELPSLPWHPLYNLVKDL